MKRFTVFFIIIAAYLFATNLVLAQNAPESLANGQISIQTFTMEKSDNKVIVGMNLNLDELKLRTNRFMAFTPIIMGENGEHVFLQSLVISGRRQHIIFQREGNHEYEGAMEVRRYNRQSQQVEYLQSIDYEPWMSGSKLRIVEDLCGCGKQFASDVTTFPIFDYHPEEGVIIALVTPEIQATKLRKEEGSAYLDFPVNQTEIYPNYRRNPIELQKIISTIDLIKNDPYVSITAIDIHGYASPEGSYSNNARLAEGRAQALKEYVRKEYSFPDSIFHVQSTPEDWDGLRVYVENSELAEKQELLKIINSTLSPDNKDQEIKKRFPATYKFMLTNWYPALRHSDYVVQYVIRPFNLEEAKELLFTRPQLLSLQEIFMVAQSYSIDNPKYQEVFETAARLFPDNATANLNVAIAALNRHDWEMAERYLERAGDSVATQHARGVLLLRQGDLDNAEPLLQQAVEAGVPEAVNNLNILHKMKSNRF